MSAQLRWQLRWKLSVLWALQWGITGAILTYLPLYFKEKNISPEQLGQLMAVSAVGLWIAPFVVGQICDRWLGTEKYLAISHLLGGFLLLAIPIATDLHAAEGRHFNVLLILVGLHAAAYFPTIPLASSLSFKHLSDPEKQFGSVRIWGTVGWVLAGLSLSFWLGRTEATEWITTNYPSWKPTFETLAKKLYWVAAPASDDCFKLGALLSFTLSAFCVFLPSTPPARSQKGTIAPIKTLSLFKQRGFTTLILTTFLLAVAIPFYSLAVPKLIEQLGVHSNWVPAVMTIGQLSEFPALLLLAFFLKRYGLKTTFALGMIAWIIRYFFFAMEQPLWLILFGISLHGICHVFLIVVIQLYIDSQCQSDIKASAQNLFAFITMGIAMPIGFVLGGKLEQLSTNAATGATSYRILFTTPAALILVVLVVYWYFFHVDDGKQAENSPPTNSPEPISK